eukprot:CAMPEP_0170589754 /NCGR_PEP_ID=MMETSP0224-20130122/11510_1 /TAXON_ID=285029 /ORGANISM="Togula jolla, Strain CCCM 725" /LENGTH=319 /DNA_ID=CAMNT_0010913515 /DNA_START=58 /DNA_END=1014 /DNA_ORIENTATION=-
MGESAFEDAEVDETMLEEAEAMPQGRAVKMQVPTPSRIGSGVKRKAYTESRPAISEPELFREQKRTELSLRDISCKAICSIKYGLRQPGAQADGKPFIPADWDKTFKPSLGSYLKFLLGRPDQFRVVEGARPGLYTVRNVATNQTVVAPVKGDKGKGKWVDTKGKGKGKGKDFFQKGTKGKGKGKDTFGKGWWPGAGKGEAPVSAAPAAPERIPPPLPATAAARLLAEAAKEELAAAAVEAEEETAYAGMEEAWEEADEQEVLEEVEEEAIEGDEENWAEQEEGDAEEEEVYEEEEPAAVQEPEQASVPFSRRPLHGSL